MPGMVTDLSVEELQGVIRDTVEQVLEKIKELKV